MLKFYYFADIKRTLYDAEYQSLLLDMYEANIRYLWMFWYNSGTWYATEAEARQAKEYLGKMGFQVGGCACLVGHPGESLDPGGEEEKNYLPKAWQYRIGRDGRPVKHCGCINEAMMADAVLCMEAFARIGIREVFFDDDLRVENFSHETGGCFCDDCLAEFARRGYAMSREALVSRLDRDMEITHAWQRLGCDRVFEFVRRLHEAGERLGIRIGIMLMPMGDERHGLDAARLTAAFPDMYVRVGEFHYDDASFESDEGHREQISWIRKHLGLLANPANAFSETTAYPADALSADNLIEKIKLEIGQSLRNIYLMSGLQTYPRYYFQRLREVMPELQKLAGE